MDAQGFRDLAEAAFPATNPPDEVVSELAREIHDGAASLEAGLQGRDWTQVEGETLENCAKNVVALTVPAFVHYIPAFMCQAMQAPDSEAATYAMYALCPLGNFDSFYEGTCSLFSPIQASVIAAFLSAMHGEPSFTLFEEEMTPGIELWKRRASA